MITAVRVVAWILFAFAALGVCAYVSQAAYALPISLAALAPYLMLVAVPTLLAFALTRQWIGAGLSLAVVIFLVAVTVPLYVADDAPAGGVQLRVLTVNARIGQADPADVVRVARENRADFLMVEELSASLLTALGEAGLDRVLPHHEADPAPGASAGAGTGLWSRYPLQRTDSLRLSLRSIVARADVPGLDVSPTVVALHVAGPFPAASLWVKDMDHLPSRLQALPSDAPVIVGGDFNATYTIRPFRALLDDVDSGRPYEDAGDQAGAGLLRTYPSNGPVIGIDHVITRGAVGTEVRTIPVKGTDHRALLAVVTVPR